MIKSMTGYGKAELSRGGRTIIAEMKTVNHRYLDMSFRMPHTLNYLEGSLRSYIKNRLVRGRCDVFISYRNENTDAAAIRVNLPVLDNYLAMLKDVCEHTGVPYEPDIKLLLSVPDAFIKDASDDEDELSALVTDCLEACIDKLIAARASEGEALKADILSRLVTIEGYLATIIERQETVPAEYREKLKARIEEILCDIEVNEEKLISEVVFFTEKSSIAEEITRLTCHIASMRNELNNCKGEVGKKLDFITQEMNREINTTGSKSSDSQIAACVISIKSELEKIREQIQNIE